MNIYDKIVLVLIKPQRHQDAQTKVIELDLPSIPVKLSSLCIGHGGYVYCERICSHLAKIF